MKKHFMIFLGVALTLFSCKNNTAEISGTLKNPVPEKYVYLEQLMPEEIKRVDSSAISADGKFLIRREIEEPSFYLLKITDNNFLTMVLEPGEKITFASHYDSLSYPEILTGSKGTELMAEYNQTLRRSIMKFSALNGIYMENIDNPDLPEVIESLDSMAQSYLSEINAFTKDYIDENLNSLVSLVALYQQIAPSIYVMNPSSDMAYFTKVDSSLRINFPENPLVISLHEQITEMQTGMHTHQHEAEASEEGEEAPEIELPSPEGDTIRLSSTRGQYVLLDFWAAWCRPCRIENPNLVQAYDKYHKKGFQIFQVSLDKTKDAWVKGIKDDKLERWIHVSDIKYWNSVVVPLYNIESIPANFLLDKEGRIIARNLRGEQLEKKLSELFN